MNLVNSSAQCGEHEYIIIQSIAVLFHIIYNNKVQDDTAKENSQYGITFISSRDHNIEDSNKRRTGSLRID